MARIVYDFGDGSRNTQVHSYGTTAENPILWINADATSTVIYNATAPAYSGTDWSARDSGNGWTNLLSTLGNRIGSTVSSGSFSGSATRTVSLSLDSTKEYVFYANGYSDEDTENNFGSVYLTVNGASYTLQQCIDNGYIKPLVLFSRALSDHSSHNNDLSSIMNGGNSAYDDYGTNMFWRIMFISSKGCTITAWRFYYTRVESGGWKVGNAEVCGFPCLGITEKTGGIYLGAIGLSSILYGTKDVSAVYYKGIDIWGGGSPIVPTFQYDYKMTGTYNEVDILYTTDTHLRWLGNAGSDYTYSPVFSLQNIADYKDSLWNAGIPTFMVDCGDWVHGGTNTDALRNEIINFYNNCGTQGLTKYLAVTYGNHEWYEQVGSASECNSYLARINNMTACNLYYNNVSVYKGYRAIKVGDKKIGIIGVGYPSPNGRGGRNHGESSSLDGYVFYDSLQVTTSNPNSALYVKVQAIIDMMKERDFDYIIAITHMDKYADENFSADNRFNSRADFLIQNTNGLDLVIPGHYNYEIDQVYTFTDLGGRQVKVVREAGASCHSFGRIKLKFDGTEPDNYLLKSQSDLEVI